MSSLDNPRIFNPAQQIRGNPSKTMAQPSDILHHDTETGVRRLIMYALFVPETPRNVQNSLVVAISGGWKGMKAGYGIYFASDSPLNSSGLLPNPDPVSTSSSTVYTKQKAEFYALSKALDIVEEKFEKTSRLVVITDSTSLVQGLAENVWEWEFNGYKDAKGKDVVDGDVFKELHKRIGRLEGGGMDVSFWLVEREWNAEADDLADAAIESEGD